MKSFRELKVWQKSHALTLRVYLLSAPFPKSEIYGLTSQMRRASASIPANIAEGCGRSGDAEFARFLQIAMGSASELEYHFILAPDLSFITELDFLQLEQEVIEVKRMLAGLIQKLNAKS